jgi:hypothetical protein
MINRKDTLQYVHWLRHPVLIRIISIHGFFPDFWERKKHLQNDGICLWSDPSPFSLNGRQYFLGGFPLDDRHDLVDLLNTNETSGHWIPPFLASCGSGYNDLLSLLFGFECVLMNVARMGLCSCVGWWPGCSASTGFFRDDAVAYSPSELLCEQPPSVFTYILEVREGNGCWCWIAPSFGVSARSFGRRKSS